MIKIFATILLLTITGQSTDKMKNCFSKTNFDSVYKYIDAQLKKSNATFYKYGGYELCLSDTTEISFQKDGYTLFKIIKDKGVFSLAKRKQDNDRILKETNHIFCELLLSADKDLNK